MSIDWCRMLFLLFQFLFILFIYFIHKHQSSHNQSRTEQKNCDEATEKKRNNAFILILRTWCGFCNWIHVIYYWPWHFFHFIALLLGSNRQHLFQNLILHLFTCNETYNQRLDPQNRQKHKIKTTNDIRMPDTHLNILRDNLWTLTPRLTLWTYFYWNVW